MSTRASLFAMAASLRTQADVLEALAGAEDETRWADASNNPFGNPWTFRRLCREGAFPCVLGPRKQKKARWVDCVAYMEAQNYVPPAPKTKSATSEVDAFEEMIASGEVQVRQ